MKTTPKQHAELRLWAIKAKVSVFVGADVLTALLDDLDEAIAVGFAARLLAAESARVGELAAERDALAAKLDRVWEMHAPTPLGYGDNISRWDDRRPCAACGRTSPCPTVRAIGADGGE